MLVIARFGQMHAGRGGPRGEMGLYCPSECRSTINPQTIVLPAWTRTQSTAQRSPEKELFSGDRAEGDGGQTHHVIGCTEWARPNAPYDWLRGNGAGACLRTEVRMRDKLGGDTSHQSKLLLNPGRHRHNSIHRVF